VLPSGAPDSMRPSPASPAQFDIETTVIASDAGSPAPSERTSCSSIWQCASTAWVLNQRKIDGRDIRRTIRDAELMKIGPLNLWCEKSMLKEHQKKDV
jgi:hypothetical protein